MPAAATKWNFLNFTPGLVGGHCIGVDPYYLTYRAQKAGYHPDVILAGRRINDTMGVRVARECVRRLLKSGMRAEAVTVLGLTFKENVVDIRNSQVADMIRELQSFGITVQVHDPLADAAAAMHEYGLRLCCEDELAPADAVVLAVGHDRYRAAGWPLICRLLEGRPRAGDGREGHARSAPAAATDRTVAAMSGRHLRRPAMPAARRGSG